MSQLAGATIDMPSLLAGPSDQPDTVLGPTSSIQALTPSYARQQIMSGRAKGAWARAQRKRGAELCYGQHYGEDPTDSAHASGRSAEIRRRQPINLGMQQLRTLIWYLANSAGDPDITAKFAEDETHSLILNKLAEEDFQQINLVQTIQYALIDMFLGGIGIVKTGVKAGSKVFSDGTTELDPGEFFAIAVSLDDFVLDPMARGWNERAFAGFKTRISKSSVLKSGIYGRDPQEVDPSVQGNPHIATRAEAAQIIKDLAPLRNNGQPAQNVSNLTGQYAQGGNENVDRCELWETEWIIDGRIYTVVLPANPATGDADAFVDKFLLIEPCHDDKRGSLRTVWAIPGIDNAMPLSIEAMQRDLAIVADALARKITRAAIEAKKGAIYGKGEEDTALQIKKAPDNFLVPGDPSKWVPLELKGMVDELMNAMSFVESEWNKASAQSGTASGDTKNTTDSKTLGAEQANMAKAQGWMEYLGGKLETLGGEILQDWVKHALADPALNKTIPIPIAPGMNMPIQVTPELLHNGDETFQLTQDAVSSRAARFFFKIRTTSMRPKDPTMEGNQIIQFIAQALPALVRGIQMGALKPSAIRVVMRKLGIDEADEIVNDMEMMAQQQQIRMQGPPSMWGGQPDQPQPGAMGPPGMGPPGMPMGGPPGRGGPGAGLPQNP